MNATRQRNRSIDQPPVLFRLPNLQTRAGQAEPSPQSTVASSTLVGDGIRVDAAQSTVKTHPSPPHQAAPSELVLNSPTPSQPKVESSHAPEMKSWMERVGSRLILCVTLILILTSAWLTGQRMPASKPDALRSNSLVEADSAAAPRDPTSKSVDSVLNHDSPVAADSQSMLASDRESEPSDSRGEVSLKPPQSPAFEAPLSPPVAGTPSATVVMDELPREPGLSPPRPPVFNTVSVQSRSSDGFYTADTDASDPSQLVAPTQPATDLSAPATDLAAPVNNMAETTSATEPNAAQLSGVQTQTPNAPAIDPAVLVPWVLENGAAPQPVRSATPNPIVDWSRYFPSNTAPPVRSVSATEGDDSPTAVQQAIYPPSPTGQP